MTMSERTQIREDRNPDDSPDSPVGAGDSLAATRANAARLVAAARGSIDQMLSRDSEAFLEAGQQPSAQ